MKVDRQTTESGAVSDGRIDSLGKGSLDRTAAIRTNFQFALVLGDFESGLRQFKDLPAIMADGRQLGKVSAA